MAAHDTRMEIDGDVYFVRRDFDLIRHIEQAFGPVGSIDQKLRGFEFKAADLVALYKLALQSQLAPPEDEVIRTHVTDAGIRQASHDIALLIMHLFAGNKQTVAWLEDEARRAADGEADDTEDPHQAV
ncbi:MAG: hypothetical protein AAFR04_13915 [Pseudomonadota bacterium]